MTGPRADTLTDLLVRGELSATAWFEVIDTRGEQWTERHVLDPAEEVLTLPYPEVALLLAATIAVLLLAGLMVALT